MAVNNLVVILCIAVVDAYVLDDISVKQTNLSEVKSDINIEKEESEPNKAFNGVYTECLVQLSYTCLQKKTLVYLKQLDGLSEISVIGDYIKFVKLNTSEVSENSDAEESSTKSSEELSHMIDKAVDRFFNNHLIRLNALGKDISVPHTVEEFVGRKRRKGGGGGHGGGDGDGGKKKMMMMAMMCMKMKLMMMVPAMMGMMGMMSFKGMMFSMMTFMISKMMLLMKLLEKKGGVGGAGGGGDAGWAASGGGGAWMPAGGQDYGGGGGYDSNAQWSSRAIEKQDKDMKLKPITTYVKPTSYSYGTKSFTIKNLNDEVIKANNIENIEVKSRRKRGLMDVLQNAYLYWTSKMLGLGVKKLNYPKYKIVNGIKYVYYPIRPKPKTPKQLPLKPDEHKPIVTAEDFNKGEIVEGAESRMSKVYKINENVNETLEDNPWQ